MSPFATEAIAQCISANNDYFEHNPTRWALIRCSSAAAAIRLPRCDVLADVVIARAFPEILGMPVVITQRQVSDFLQVLRI